MLNVEQITQFISQDKTSVKKQHAREGLAYYEGNHKIMQSRIYYVDADGEVKEDKLRSNVRICHPFFTELVDQQVQYMLSGDDTDIIDSDIPELSQELKDYFGSGFWSELYDCLTGCVSKGFEYMYAYQRKDGKIAFQCADSMGVVEVRDNEADDATAHVIYSYIDRIDKDGNAIERIQVWDDQQTYYYVQVGEGTIELDKDAPINPRPHIVRQDEKGELLGSSFGFIPFFRLDNGKKQFSGLKPIKALIDDYDLMACSLSNNLQDFTDALYVVSGFQGTNLDELITNIKNKKVIGTAPDGGVDIKTVDIPYQARQTKLELDEKNIYRFGMGFNSAQIGDGNITNIVIKSRYALLDLKCNKLEIRLKDFLSKLLEIVLKQINDRNKTNYQIKDVDFEFKREVMTNAQDNAQIELTDAQKQGQLLNNLMIAANMLDSDTIIQRVCDILDIDYNEIKDKLPQDEEKSNQQAINTLQNTGAIDEQ